MSLKEVRNVGAADAKLRIVVDGFNAPVTAGNFVDLVQKKFYDGMEIQRADGFVVQTGDPGDDVSSIPPWPPPSAPHAKARLTVGCSGSNTCEDTRKLTREVWIRAEARIHRPEDWRGEAHSLRGHGGG